LNDAVDQDAGIPGIYV